jgi:CheY-like chemotaxis protein
MLLAETPRNGDQWEPLAEILAASDRASCLTRQLLAFSRKQVMQARSLDVSEVVTGAGKLLQRAIGEDIAFFADCMPGIPPVFADAGMIEQVLMNLALNARDAMPDGGRLVIGAWKVSVNEAMARERPRRRAGEFVCLQVSDTGCGMTAEVAGRIFEPFFTTKSPGKGTGLGLATVYNIVQMHHGWIEVESKAGLGTVFKVFLPRAEAPVDCGTKSQQELAAEGGPETVFLVEDEPGVRHLASSILRRRGYKVIEAASGIAALSIWPQHGKEVDIILTDIVMPDGVSGPELAKRLRGLKPELEVVFTSGYCAEALTGGVELQEGVNFLKKPYLPGQLAKIVRAVLDKRNAKVSSE